MSRWIAAYRIFQAETEMFLASVETILDAVDSVHIYRHSSPWSNPDQDYDMSETEDAIRSVMDRYGHRVEIFENDHDSCEKQQEWMYDHLRTAGATHALFVDFDEGYESGGVRSIRNAVMEAPEFASYYVFRYTFWKSFRWFIWPPEPFAAMAVVNLKHPDATVKESRVVNGQQSIIGGVFQYHFSYARKTDDAILQKIQSFEHAKDIHRDWYEQVWLDWNPKFLNIHPSNPPCYRCTRHAPLLLPKPFRSIAHLYDNDPYSKEAANAFR